MSDNEVILQCVKVGSKLRVRIISPGYNGDANCQFPRAIRAEGRKYSVPASAINFTENSRQKFFYRVNKNFVKVIEDEEELKKLLETLKIYEDVEETECIICMSEDKSVVYAPCGHYCSCETCANQIKFDGGGKCPICRTKIATIVQRDQIQT